ncbi:spore cortex-lytic enzyme precursor [Clostridium acetireducens DSM 10703]|uniref:Spore cortex-lytic enzyme n=1 Tax=Clostridium acetireducens DSM 10703 TaxID=1121290 RepID=A0A1E8F104_9CLOT|nr:cell wall hydrolase [Clostridium acetireducens]OFI06847.1 spore cortex-lytic enzyme precursor [Clostridium acetireducens DSM 10703]
MKKKLYLIFIATLIFSLLFSHNVKAYWPYYVNSYDLDSKNENVVQVLNYNDKNIYITDSDVYLMAQIVYAESRSEPFEGKVAVASVILNRVIHPSFPKSVEEVIKQKAAFSCVKNGEIHDIPDSSSYKAVLEALKGKDPTDKAVFFYNPDIATSKWMKNIRKNNTKKIGNHVFFLIK